MGGQWYIARAGQPEGPYDLAELRALAQQGRLGVQELVCEDGGEAWRPVGDVLGFGGVILGTGVAATALPPTRVDVPANATSAAPAPMPIGAYVHPAADHPQHPGPRPSVQPRFPTGGVPPRAALAAASKAKARVPGATHSPTTAIAVGAVTAALVATIGVVAAVAHQVRQSRQASASRPPFPGPPMGPSPPAARPLVAAALPGASASAQSGTAVTATDTDASAGDVRFPLANGSAFWRSPNLVAVDAACPSGLWALATDPAPGADEFERHANTARRPTLAAQLRATVYGRLLDAAGLELGTYDFERGAFPVRVEPDAQGTCASSGLLSAGGAVLPLDVPLAFDPAHLRTEMSVPFAVSSISPLEQTVPCERVEGIVPFEWRVAPLTFWIRVPPEQGARFRAAHADHLSGQIAFRLETIRTQRSVMLQFAHQERWGSWTLTCRLRGGAGPVIAARPVAIQINDGSTVLLDTAPTPSAQDAAVQADTTLSAPLRGRDAPHEPTAPPPSSVPAGDYSGLGL